MPGSHNLFIFSHELSDGPDKPWIWPIAVLLTVTAYPAAVDVRLAGLYPWPFRF